MKYRNVCADQVEARANRLTNYFATFYHGKEAQGKSKEQEAPRLVAFAKTSRASGTFCIWGRILIFYENSA